MGRDRGPAAIENDPSEDDTKEMAVRAAPSRSRADGPANDPYADSPGASLDSDEPVEPNEPA